MAAYSITTTVTDQINTITNSYFAGTQLQFIASLTVLAFFLVLAKLTDIIFEKIFLRLASKTKTELDDKLLYVLKTPIFVTVALIGIIVSFSMITALQTFMETIINITKTLMIIIWTAVSIKIAAILIRDVIGKAASKTKSTLDDEMLPLFSNLAKIIICFIGLMMVLSIWNIEITPILASAGIAGFAVAFAAKDTLSHLFGGISIYFDKPFKVGDRIQLDSGEYGDVKEIGIRSTRILTLDDTLIVVPNDTIANSKIINYHAPYSRMKVKLRMGVSYGSDVAKVKKTLLKVANSIPEVRDKPKPIVLFIEHGDFSLNFLLITWVDNPSLKGTVTDQLNMGIEKEFKKEGIDIPFPTQTIYTVK